MLCHSIGKMRRSCFIRLAGATVIATFVAGVAAFAVPAPVHAAAPVLPSLGEAAGDTLSGVQEREVGERIMRELRRNGTLLEDRELAEALNRFAGDIARAAPASGQAFEFFLVRDPSLNAFALPGGFVGVHTGLAIAAQTESELASVLAHEIGHVTQRHIARMLAQNQQSSLISLAAVLAAIVAAGASDGQAAAGLVALGGSVHEQQMLAFSREAEREADRVGLEILREAGFVPQDMIAFFTRMQRATRVYDTGAPAYLRTHPLTSERMADIRNRLGETAPPPARAPGLDFLLLRAKLIAAAGSERRDHDAARRLLESGLETAVGLERVAGHYGLAVVALETGDTAAAGQALERALDALRRAPGTPQGHPLLASLRVRIALQAGGAQAALGPLREAMAEFPLAGGLQVMNADLLLRAGRSDEALRFLEDRLELTRADPELWRLLAIARAEAGQPGLAHWATAERYALLGGWAAALEQLRLAGQDPALSYYELSRLDVRKREFEAELLREREER